MFRAFLNDSRELGLTGFVAWQANAANGDFEPRQLITTNVESPKGLFAADIDNYSDQDMYYTPITDNKIAWNENLTILSVNDR